MFFSGILSTTGYICMFTSIKRYVSGCFDVMIGMVVVVISDVYTMKNFPVSQLRPKTF